MIVLIWGLHAPFTCGAPMLPAKARQREGKGKVQDEVEGRNLKMICTCAMYASIFVNIFSGLNASALSWLFSDQPSKS